MSRRRCSFPSHVLHFRLPNAIDHSVTSTNELTVYSKHSGCQKASEGNCNFPTKQSVCGPIVLVECNLGTVRRPVQGTGRAFFLRLGCCVLLKKTQCQSSRVANIRVLVGKCLHCFCYQIAFCYQLLSDQSDRINASVFKNISIFGSKVQNMLIKSGRVLIASRH